MAVKQLPPHSEEAEEAVLGAMLIDPDARHRVQPIVQPGDFHLAKHRAVYQAILDLDGTPPDVLAVHDQLERSGQLKLVGGLANLTRLINLTPTSLHAEHYAAIVADYAVRRKLIEVGTKIVQRAWTTNGDGDPLAFAHKAIMDVSTRTSGGLVPVPQAVGELFDQVEHWTRNPLEFGQVRGLSTGIDDVDYLLEGMEPGDLLLMAGRPSMGKSALAFEIARRVGEAGHNVIIFSLEMTKAKILARWSSAISQVNSRKIKRGTCPTKYLGTDKACAYVSPDELSAYVSAMNDIHAMRSVAIDDTPALTCAEIRSRALAKAQRVGGVDLVVVDHSGLIRSDGGRNENTAKAEGRKSQVLKELAKELECPVILVQQLSRATEHRQNKRPSLGDLRDSGEHEQNADVVLGLYRDSYYKQGIMAGTQKDLELEVLVLKHRDGATGVKRTLRYERYLSRFTEFAR